jgi:hypothetical protein
MVFIAGAALGLAPAIVFSQSDSAKKRPFIGRILGVFDMSTGEPIDGVEVLDMKTKSWALTTFTGTVALSFVDSAGGIIRLRKVGFEPQMLTVTNYSDEGAITAVLTRSGVALPAVTTTAKTVRGPADTSRKLERNGYYDRRDKLGASPMAFVAGERLDRLITFGDFGKFFGRPVCEGNLYVDGIRVKGMQVGEGLGARGGRIAPGNIRRNLADQFVDPSSVLAVENYRVGEVPAEYNQTKSSGASHECGATLIWTK